MRERRILEIVGALLNSFRLPRELTIEVRGCNGSETAWYDRDKAVFCYEYVELIQRHAPKVATPGGVQRGDAIVGAVIDTLLHESGHAIFDLLEIPVMGREEDAADFFGREAEVKSLLEAVESTLAPGADNARIIAVVGPSGSGKSSVVMAGLLPRLLVLAGTGCTLIRPRADALPIPLKGASLEANP